MMIQSSVRPLWVKSEIDPERVALWDEKRSQTFAQLERSTSLLISALLQYFQTNDLHEARVAALVSPSAHYVSAQWAVWRAGGVHVPLCTSHPLPELEYSLRDSDASALIYDFPHAERARELQLRLPDVKILSIEEMLAQATMGIDLPALEITRRAQILYTSGTTGKPKGVVTTHANLLAQIQVLVDQWGWSSQDHTLHVLPLHHTHGIINVLCCALAVGASVEFFEKFDARKTWERIALGRDKRWPTVFMAVPTIYSKLIDAYENASAEERSRYSEAAGRLRLMVSGSAALPVSTLKRWEEITGQVLLERYGMTEIGMALSNPLEGERRPGTVGKPLPGSRVRIVDGELQVSGGSVFLEYFRKPQETAEAFTEDGWFKTGDQVEVSADGYYRILGRSSVDILKTGGYKVSALEIEAELRVHPAVMDAAVVGVPDSEWGEKVAAALVVRAGTTIEQVEQWLKERLAAYKVPRLWRDVSELPRNTMGKVLKKSVLELFTEESRTGASAESNKSR
ncbi:MAG: acyl-CoA synthetase [Bdellovibrionales bacterium]|nr:acyl-CoA synthetase [Bdellovibrionales bacterium]